MAHSLSLGSELIVRWGYISVSCKYVQWCKSGSIAKVQVIIENIPDYSDDEEIIINSEEVVIDSDEDKYKINLFTNQN